jgi:hypothetical protein
MEAVSLLILVTLRFLGNVEQAGRYLLVAMHDQESLKRKKEEFDEESTNGVTVK